MANEDNEQLIYQQGEPSLSSSSDETVQIVVQNNHSSRHTFRSQMSTRHVAAIGAGRLSDTPLICGCLFFHSFLMMVLLGVVIWFIMRLSLITNTLMAKSELY